MRVSSFTVEVVEESDSSRLPTSVSPRLSGTKLLRLPVVPSDTLRLKSSRTRGTRNRSTCGHSDVSFILCSVVSLVSHRSTRHMAGLCFDHHLRSLRQPSMMRVSAS